MSDLRRENEELKQKRALIDQKILGLLIERARLSRDWAKRARPSGATLPSSEQETLDALAASAQGELPAEAVVAIFREIHASCRALEAPVRAVFVGAEGSAASLAARRKFGPLAKLVPAESLATALSLVESKQSDFAVLPYESAHEGLVLGTLLALRQRDLKIIAVDELDAMPSLLNRTGKLDDIEKVYATASDRVQSEAALSALAPRAVLVDVKSAQQACQLAAEDQGAAALAIGEVGKPFDLVMAGPALTAGAAHPASMRFCVVSARPASRTGHDATVVLFSVSDEPGALFEVLKQFAERGVNLRKIHSRPTEGDGLSYLFFVEVTGHMTDRPVVTALEGLKRQTKMMKVLGSYPVLVLMRLTLAHRRAWLASLAPLLSFALVSVSALAVAGCGAKESVVAVGDGKKLSAEEIDADPLALLPGGAIMLAQLDVESLLSSSVGPQVLRLSTQAVPLTEEMGFSPQRDLKSIAAGAYSMQGADGVFVAKGTFNVEGIKKAADKGAVTALGKPLQKTEYGGNDLYMSGDVGFVLLTPKTMLGGNPTGLRRALDRLKMSTIKREVPDWMLEVLQTPDAKAAIAGDFRDQPVSAALASQMPFINGLQRIRALADFKDPGVNLVGSLTYSDAQMATTGEARIKQLGQMSSWLNLLSMFGVSSPVRSLQTNIVSNDVQFIAAFDGAALSRLVEQSSVVAPQPMIPSGSTSPVR